MPSLQLPRLRSGLALVADDGDGPALRSATHDFTIGDAPPWVAKLLELLDGSRDVAAVAAAIPGQPCLDDVSAALEDLRAHGLIEDAADDALLSRAECERYGRQLRYFSERSERGNSAAQAQLSLRESHVAVLGLGALGGKVAELLTAAGVGAISAVDGDLVELSNLNRQTLYTEADIGRPKAEVAADRLGRLNSGVRFSATNAWLASADDVEAVVQGVDFVVDAVDSPPHEIERWVNAACFGLGIPYLGMSHYPPAIRVGPTYVPGQTGCYGCQEAAWRAKDPLFDRPPTKHPAALGATAAAVAGFAVMEVMAHLTGSSRTTLGSALMVDLSTGEVRRSSVQQLHACRTCG